MERHGFIDGRQCLWLCLLALGVAFYGGCGGSERRSVEGTVNLNGSPLEKGAISFRPQAGTASPSAGAEIVNGRFSTPADRGLLPGKFRVEITASRLTGKTIRDPLRGMVPEEVQFLPAKYNTTSELELDIPSESWKVTKSFDLTD